MGLYSDTQVQVQHRVLAHQVGGAHLLLGLVHLWCCTRGLRLADTQVVLLLLWLCSWGHLWRCREVVLLWVFHSLESLDCRTDFVGCVISCDRPLHGSR